MIDERTAQLISAALDDALGETEREELDRQLAASDEARNYFEAMKRLDKQLANTPQVQEPYELHGRIMRALPVTTERSGFLLAPFWSSVARYGLAAAAGVLFAVGIYETKPEDASQMSGTMAPKGIVVDGYDFSVDGLSSTVELERQGDRYVLDVTVDADEETELSIAFSGDAYRLSLLEQTENEFEFCEFADGVIRAGVRGDHRFTVALAPRDDAAKGKDAAIALEYVSDGRMVQKTLEPGR